jgi:hypothetical protein
MAMRSTLTIKTLEIYYVKIMGNFNLQQVKEQRKKKEAGELGK